MKIAIDARESGTSTGRYMDKLIEYLHRLQPEHEIIVLTKPHRLDYMRQIAPSFTTLESPYKEFTFAEQLGFLKQLKGLRADLVHFTMTQQPVLYRFGPRRPPAVVHLRHLRAFDRGIAAADFLDRGADAPVELRARRRGRHVGSGDGDGRRARLGGRGDWKSRKKQSDKCDACHVRVSMFRSMRSAHQLSWKMPAGQAVRQD